MTPHDPRLEQLLILLDANPNLSIAELAAKVYVSPAHLQRLFRARCGIPLGQYRRLLQLDRAASQLAYRAIRITDIAFDAGYDSPEAFSRAFEQFVGVSPRAFRQQPDWHTWQAQLQQLQPVPHHPRYQLRWQQRQAEPVLLLRHRGPLSNLGPTIGQFIATRKAHQLPPSAYATYNLWWQGSPPTLALACSRPLTLACPPGFELTEIPAGFYAALDITGDDHAIEAASRWLCQQLLDEVATDASAPLESNEFPLIVQRHRWFPDVPAGAQQSTLWLAVAPYPRPD